MEQEANFSDPHFRGKDIFFSACYACKFILAQAGIQKSMLVQLCVDNQII